MNQAGLNQILSQLAPPDQRQFIGYIQRIEGLKQEIQKVQVPIPGHLQSLNTTKAALNENQQVLKEIDTLDDDDVILKHVGPLMIKQDRPDVLETVNGRIKFLNSQIKSTNKQIEQIQKKVKDLTANVTFSLKIFLYSILASKY